MKRVFSNGGGGDFVCNPFDGLVSSASSLRLAAPYFTEAQQILHAAAAGKPVQLLVGLNAATHPDALRKVMNAHGVAVRYLTHRFHAKIFLFDDEVLVGSSNLTDGGMRSNREAVVRLDASRDGDAVDEVRALFAELWQAAASLTEEKLAAFSAAWRSTRSAAPSADEIIEGAIGRVEAANIDVGSRSKSRERIFHDELHRLVLEQYRPAFREVTGILEQGGFRRPELTSIGASNETNRFLSWVRQTHAAGEAPWRDAPLRTRAERDALIRDLGTQWSTTTNSMVSDGYLDWLANIQGIFGSEATLRAADRDTLTTGLMSLHAFEAQARFTKGGVENLPPAFWRYNKDDVGRVRGTLNHLLNGPGDFVARLHDTLYEPQLKLSLFGKFCALELYGTIRPDTCPPLNGRMAKGLRYLGFDVPPNG